MAERPARRWRSEPGDSALSKDVTEKHTPNWVTANYGVRYASFL